MKQSCPYCSPAGADWQSVPVELSVYFTFTTRTLLTEGNPIPADGPLAYQRINKLTD